MVERLSTGGFHDAIFPNNVPGDAMRCAQLTLVGLLLLLFATQSAQGQERERREKDEDRKERREDRGRRDRDADRDDRERRRRRRDRGGDAWADDDYEERRRGERGKRGRGPKFCRNGEGHPVHGREWCIEKGFGLGDARYDEDRYDDEYDRDDRYGDGRYGDYDRRRWRRVKARDITLDVGLFDRFTGRLDEDALRRTLGRDAFYRLREHQRRLRLRGRLEGRFDRGGGIFSGDRRERTLRVRADGRPLARFVDRDGDERVEFVLLRRRSR